MENTFKDVFEKLYRMRYRMSVDIEKILPRERTENLKEGGFLKEAEAVIEFASVAAGKFLDEEYMEELYGSK